MGEVTAAVFRDGRVIEHIALDVSQPQSAQAPFLWIEVLSPDVRDFALLQERFGLHGLAVKDSMHPTHIPKVDVYDDQIFVVLEIARLRDGEIVYAEIDAFVSGRHIITIRHDEDAEFMHVHDELANGPRASRRGRISSYIPSWNSW